MTDHDSMMKDMAAMIRFAEEFKFTNDGMKTHDAAKMLVRFVLNDWFQREVAPRMRFPS